jgi:hypothetical protein
MKTSNPSRPVLPCRGPIISRRLLVAILFGVALLCSGCKDLKQKNMDLAESCLDCLDDMIASLREVNSPQSLQSALPGFRAAADRFAEIIKEGRQLERDEGRAKLDPDVERNLESRMDKKKAEMTSEIQRISRIPGISPSDMMAIGQTLMNSLRSAAPAGDSLSPPAGSFGFFTSPPAPPDSF